MSRREKILYGEKAQLVHRDNTCSVYRLGGEDGEIRMTVYPVFSGIDLIYHDIHASHYQLEGAQMTGMLEINHCREGRIEQEYRGAYYFLSPGDLSVVSRDGAQGFVRFPTGHYHGVTVRLDIRHAPECLTCILQDVNVRPEALMGKFCSGTGYFAARSSARVEHIFSELYAVPEEIRKGYFKVKILELLLFLSALPVQKERASYSAAQVRLAGVVEQYLLEHTEENVTAAALAARFGVSPSHLAASFRGVYGMTPAAFLRAGKMRGAAQLLRSTDRTVLDIAGQFGYDNASKFAKAFRNVIGVSPNAYRAGAEQDSCAPQ